MLRTLKLPYCWAIIWNLIPSAIAVLIVSSPEAEDTHGHFVDMKRCKNTKHNIPQNSGNTVHCRVSIVYPHDCMADWELWLSAAAQHHERISTI